MRPIYVTLLFIALSCSQANTQSCGAITYDAKDGLAATNYMGIFQDSKGILWLGSYGSGVSRFDGKRWENWTTAMGMQSNTVGNIFEDQEGGLWFNHNDQGVSRWKDGQWQKFDYHQDSCVKGLLCFDQSQKMVYIIENGWYGKFSTRVYKYDFTSRKFLGNGKSVLPENLASHYAGFEIMKGEKENEWWVNASNSTVFHYYHVLNGQAQQLPALPGSYEDYPRPVYATAALSPETGDAIVQNANGIYILKNKQWQAMAVPTLPRYTIGNITPKLEFTGCSHDPESKSLFSVWYLDDNSHEKRYLLAEYDDSDLRLRTTLIFSNLFWDLGTGRQIRKDRAGTIWATTAGNVLRLFPDQLYLPVSAPGMPSQAWGVAQTGDGNIWFSSYDIGLACFDGLYLRPSPTALKNITKFNDGSLTDNNGHVYFNTATQEDGILKFDGKNHWSFLAGGKNVQGFYLNRDNNGRILWGTSALGLWILPEGKTGKDTTDWLKIDRSKGLLLDNVLTTLQDQNGRYWMGRTSQGVAMYDLNTKQVQNWLRSQDARNYGCASMAEDTRGNLWFGTDRGLCFFENRPDIGPDFDLQQHLLRVGIDFTGESTVLSCLAYDAHTLVIGNKEGLHLLDLDAFYGSPRRVLLRSLNLKNGYQAGPVGQNALYIDRDSCLWLTASNGAFRYNPHLLPRDMAIPQVFVDSLLASAIIYKDFSSSLPLGSDQRFLQIYFHAPPNPLLYDNLRFEYRLTGDSVWVKILPGAAFVTFSSLKAGSYRFELRAVKEGLFSAPAVVVFRISPVLWETPLFWLLVLGLVIGIGGLWRRREVKISHQQLQISQQQLQLEKSINEMAGMLKEKDKLQVQAIVNQLNPHFINNALQWLQVRVDEDEEAVRVVGKLSENISTVFKNSRMKRAYHSMREEMKLTENYLFIQKCRFGDKLTYEMPDEATLAKLENMCVPLMIVQIHAENAVEHGIRSKSNGVGRVSISLREAEAYAVITIEDDGVGRNAAKKIGSKGTQNGTTMLRELEAIYNKQNQLPLEQLYQDDIFVDAAGNGYGTRVIVRMPKDYNFEF